MPGRISIRDPQSDRYSPDCAGCLRHLPHTMAAHEASLWRSADSMRAEPQSE